MEDVYAVDPELGALGAFLRRNEDGTFVAGPFDYEATRDGPDARENESLSAIEENCDCCVEEQSNMTSMAEEMVSSQVSARRG